MREGKLLNIIGEIQEDYVEEAYPEAEMKRGRRQELEAMPWVGEEVPKKTKEGGGMTGMAAGDGKEKNRKKRGAKKRFYIAAALCLCLAAVVSAILAGRKPKYVPGETFFHSVLMGGFLEEPGYAVVDQILYFAYVKVGERMGEYHMENTYGGMALKIPQMDTTTIRLKKKLGELYQGEDENGRSWYRVKGTDHLESLISKDENGLLRLWKFASFLLGPAPGERKEGIYYTADKYPGADVSPYTYGEILSTIYGLTDAAEIESITAKAQKTNSSPLGIQMQEEVGSHTYAGREQVESIYDAIAGAVCEASKGAAEEKPRFRYSFTVSEGLKLSGGRSIYGTRDLVIRTVGGEEIDFLKYDAHMGYIYNRGGSVCGYLDDEAVGILNGIFGIE